MDSTASRHYFSPPLYMQRYQFIIDMVKRIRPKTVMDLGCADCSLLRKLRFHRNGIEVLVGVDIDASVVRKEMHALAPLSSDYLQPNDRPLTIKLYQGSVTEKEPCTTGFDLVTCVELIEHLQLMEVKAFSEVVFEHMAPGTVIVSTPNVEFNPLLPGLTGFRHNNHKFEWTRAEFQAWSYGVCQEYGYSVEFSGVGEAPEQAIDVGFCSQIAVFSRQHHASGRDVSLEPVVYTLLYEVDYPSLTDNNIFQRLLVNEALYAAENLKRQWLEGIPSTRTTESNPAEEESSNSVVRPLPYRLGDYICVPLASIWFCPKVKTLCRTVQCLQERLLDDSKIQLSNDGEAVVLAADEEEEEEEEEEELENEDAPLGAWEGPAAPSQDEDWEAELWSDLT